MGAVPCCCFLAEQTSALIRHGTREEEPHANAMWEAKALLLSDQANHTVRQKKNCTTLVSAKRDLDPDPTPELAENKNENAVATVTQKPATPISLDLLTRALAQTTALPPDRLHDARDGKLRLLHVLCPFWIQVYSIWFKKRQDKQRPVHRKHGFFLCKKREEAIFVCEQAGYHAGQEGFSTIDTLQDPTNAPASTTPEACADTISKHSIPEDPVPQPLPPTTTERLRGCAGC